MRRAHGELDGDIASTPRRSNRLCVRRDDVSTPANGAVELDENSELGVGSRVKNGIVLGRAMELS